MFTDVTLIVIIPAYNEEMVIASTLKSIIDAGVQPIHIYVINDASKDRTAEFAGAMGVNVINNPKNLGKAGGVTRALDIILSDNDHITHVCFLDADTILDEDYFNEMQRTLHNDMLKCYQSGGDPISVLCGKVKSIPHNWLTAFRAYELWQSHAIHKIAQAKLKGITVAPGCTSTYSVKALRNVDWSEDTSTEDMDATIQVALNGGIIKYESKAIVYTQDPSTIKDYIGQIERRWYPGTWQVMGKHGILWKGPFKALNWECRLMVLEPIAYVTLLMYNALFNHDMLAWILGVSFVIIMILSIMASIGERRLDILFYSITFPLILFVNLMIFTSKVGNIFGRNKQTLKWYSPERYSINEGAAK
jgi:cellulose synthase/poly-beta-1,6-N-acetylglucosamine synthase-like glycosyltransferase